jgi:hypothetical protein
MRESPASDTVALFRSRMRSYFVRVLLLVAAVVVVLFVSRAVLGASPTVGAVLGVAALVGVVGGSYVVHWKTVRCPSCERWLAPLGVNGFAPSQCPHCKAQLR